MYYFSLVQVKHILSCDKTHHQFK